MTGDGYQVVADELDSHAGTLDRLADDLGQALEAAESASMHGQAYGKICMFFVPVVQYISEPCRQQLGEASATLEQTASDVRDTARRYRDVDTANAASLRVDGW